MIKSMTGYGKGETASGNKKITAEVRSLNSKQLDLNVRIPSIYRSQEYEIRAMAAKALQRGKVDLTVSYELQGETTPVKIDKALFGTYFRQLEQIAAENKVSWSKAKSSLMASVLRLPEVICNDAPAVDECEAKALEECVAMALAAIDRFRKQEGAVLMTDMLARIDRIEGLKNNVVPYEQARSETVKSRIRENIASLGMSVDQNRLEQEMIYYIEKLDITEEKVRLQNHLDYFREVSGEEGAGRKLGFISQEIGREINTLGSKANEANIQKIVVVMKDELEKIKEQLLNIL